MIKGYYFITSLELSLKGNASDVKAALEAKVTVIQYRDKDAVNSKIYKEACELRSLCDKKALFIVNDSLDMALACNADGIHLGQSDMTYSAARKLLPKPKIIGLTAHNLEEALNAQKLGADYIGLSPIFSTTTKLDAGQPCGLDLIKEIKDLVRIPLVAIGGITLENAPEVVAAGADSLCAISAVITKPDAVKEMVRFQKLFNIKQPRKTDPDKSGFR